jgi:transcriptional regulator with XRE-family HTH domain
MSPTTFGQLIREQRVKLGQSQKDLAALLKKENGDPISAQYLNDVEFDRRKPPSAHVIKQLAHHLKIREDALIVASGRVPDDVRKVALNNPDASAIGEAFRAFRKKPQ